MRLGAVLVFVALGIAACGPTYSLPPAQNSLAKRIEPQPGRSLIYVYGNASLGTRGSGLLLLASTNDPAPGHAASAQEFSQTDTAKLRVFNTTFTLIDAPEGVVRLVAEDPHAGNPGSPAQVSNPFVLHVQPGRKYYVRVNASGGDTAQPAFVTEGAPDGARDIASSQLSGYVRLSAAPETPAQSSAAPPLRCEVRCS